MPDKIEDPEREREREHAIGEEWVARERANQVRATCSRVHDRRLSLSLSLLLSYTYIVYIWVAPSQRGGRKERARSAPLLSSLGMKRVLSAGGGLL